MKTCDSCTMAAFNGQGIYCTEFHESINDPTVAEDCGMYDPLAKVEVIPDDPPATPTLTLVSGETWEAGATKPSVVDFKALRARNSTTEIASTPVDEWKDPDVHGPTHGTRWSSCGVCAQLIGWVDCPTGGWWRHEVHPDDGHEAVFVESTASSWARQPLNLSLWQVGPPALPLRIASTDVEATVVSTTSAEFDITADDAAIAAGRAIRRPDGTVQWFEQVAWNGDRERRLVVQLDIPFYGQPHHAKGSMDTIKRLCRLHFHGATITEIPESEWKGATR